MFLWITGKKPIVGVVCLEKHNTDPQKANGCVGSSLVFVQNTDPPLGIRGLFTKIIVFPLFSFNTHTHLGNGSVQLLFFCVCLLICVFIPAQTEVRCYVSPLVHYLLSHCPFTVITFICSLGSLKFTRFLAVGKEIPVK